MSLGGARPRELLGHLQLEEVRAPAPEEPAVGGAAAAGGSRVHADRRTPRDPLLGVLARDPLGKHRSLLDT